MLHDARAEFAARLTELIERSGLRPDQISARVRPTDGAQWRITPRLLDDWTCGRQLPREKPLLALVELLIEECGRRGVLPDLVSEGLLDGAGWWRRRRAAAAVPARRVASAEPRTAFAHGADVNGLPTAVVFDPGPLPRLRHLREMASDEAGRVPWSYADAGSLGAFASGLYVRRDLEPALLEALRHTPHQPRLIIGEPGYGKTSLLWGLASRLLGEEDCEVFLIKSAWLLPTTDSATPAVGQTMLVAAIDQALAEKRHCIVLIDTADILAGNESALLQLREMVRAATEHSASVVVASRPAEANSLPSSWRRMTLGAFATSAAADQTASEFERAVASYARFYCRTDRDAEKLGDQLLGAVARRQPMEPLCRRPLTLRMLSELYSPGTVPQSIDVTGLYETYWLDRLVQDRRVWSRSAPSADTDADLTEIAYYLALRMFQSGVPQVRLADVVDADPQDTIRHRSDIELLCRRGVGEITHAGEFEFFHQTFFEFAAARALLAKRGDAVAALQKHILSDPTDFVRLAVLEQTYLCAWRIDERRADAVTAATLLLTALADDLEAIPYTVRRLLISVLFQVASLPDDVGRQLIAVIASTDKEMLRECLALMPAPRRASIEGDLALLERCVARDDATWVAVADVLSRLAGRDPKLALRAVFQLGLVDKVENLPFKDMAARHEVPRLLARLVTANPAAALEGLSRLCRVAILHKNVHYLAGVFAFVHDARPGVEEQVATWADGLVEQTTGTEQRPIVAYAALHGDRALALARRRGWDPLLTELRDVVRRSAEAILPRDRGVFGGLLATFAEAAPQEYASEIVDLLRPIDSRDLLSELHRGWLAALIRSENCSFRQQAVDWLVAGLPAIHGSAESGPQFWAEAVRRALERPDFPVGASVEIATEAVRRLDPALGDAWIDPDLMLRLVTRAAAFGVSDAVKAFDVLRDPTYPLSRRAVRTLEEKLRENVAGLGAAEVEAVLALALRRRDLKTLADLSGQSAMPRSALDSFVRDNASGLSDLVVESLASELPRTRRVAAMLLERLVTKALLPCPSWELLASGLETHREPSVRTSLIAVALHGATHGAYSFDRVRQALTGMIRTNADGALQESVDVQTARRSLVSLHAICGRESDYEEVLRLAYLPPIDPRALDKPSSFLLAAHRVAPGPGSAVRTRFLITMGGLLATSGTIAAVCKDTAARWREAMAETMEFATATEQRSVLDAIPAMEPNFAAAVVSKFDVLTGGENRSGLTRLIDDPDTHDLVRKAARIVLKNSTPTAAAWKFDSGLRPGPAGVRTVVVLTASESEYRAVRQHLTDLDTRWHRAGTAFETGSLHGLGRIALALVGEGNQQGAVLAERVITEFDPEALLSVGAAMALNEDVGLGDVVVATKVYGYHGGRADDEGLLAHPRAWESSHRLEQLAHQVSVSDTWTDLLSADQRAMRRHVHFLPIASGEVVLASGTTPLTQYLHRVYNDAVAIDTVSSGISLAGHLSSRPVLAVRGISGRAEDPRTATDRTAVAEVRDWHAAAVANAVAFALAVAAVVLRQDDDAS